MMAMNFRRSLIVSVMLHTLLFGSALAAIQYGHLLGRSDAITVVLVGPDMSSAPRRGSHAAERSEVSRQHRELSRNASEARSSDTTGKLPAEPETVRASDTMNRPEVEDGTGASEISGHAASAGRAASQLGLVTPEQWQLIQAALERAKTYPRQARERGVEGVVHVRFRVLPSGNAERVEILKSSGSGILDSASIRTVYRSGPLPPVKGWVEVPIAYVLE
jgi:periplasmic protein TonB